MLPDYKLIQELRNRYLGQGVDSLTRSEACDLINHLHEAVSDKDQTIADLRAQLAELKEKNEEWEQTFDLTYKADVRGIEMFRKAHPEYAEQLKMPSTDKLICWLLEQLAAKEAELDLYRKAVEPVREADAAAETASIPYSVQDPFVDMARIQCAGAIKNCVRILGEAGNDKS